MLVHLSAGIPILSVVSVSSSQTRHDKRKMNLEHGFPQQVAIHDGARPKLHSSRFKISTAPHLTEARRYGGSGLAQLWIQYLRGW